MNKLLFLVIAIAAAARIWLVWDIMHDEKLAQKQATSAAIFQHWDLDGKSPQHSAFKGQ